jgi:hypothetical protein
LTFAQSNLTEAVLLDDGNFVLRDRLNPSSIFWESFDHPTDTLLPSAKLGIDKVTRKAQQLISWRKFRRSGTWCVLLGVRPRWKQSICPGMEQIPNLLAFWTLEWNFFQQCS